MEIIPSVLAKSETELQDIKKKLAFHQGTLHIDIADGKFVHTVTVGREEIEKNFSNPLHIHLMVENPAEVVPLWLDLKNLNTIIFHVEATDRAEEIINNIHQAGKKVGIAINPDTNSEKLEPLIGKADFFHFMTVYPGDYGAEFQKEIVQRIGEFHAKHRKEFISADGGVNPQREPILVAQSVSSAVVGSYILKSPNPEEAFKEFNQ